MAEKTPITDPNGKPSYEVPFTSPHIPLSDLADTMEDPVFNDSLSEYAQEDLVRIAAGLPKVLPEKKIGITYTT